MENQAPGRRPVWGRIRGSVLIIALLLGLFMVVKYNWLNLGSFLSLTQDAEKDSTIITERVEKLCELATVKYNYQGIVSFSESTKIGELELPEILGGKKVLLTYRAYLKGGCQLREMTITNDQIMRVVLSPGEILDNVLVLDSLNIYDVQEGIFNKFEIQADTDLVNADMEQYAAEKRAEIVKDAENNAAAIIRGFLESINYQDVEIVFE